MSRASQKPLRVLITGASGFIGGALVRKFAGSPGYEVTAASRSAVGESLPGVNWLQVSDQGVFTRWHQALEGVDIVIHCAGATKATRNSGDTLCVINAHSTENLARQAIQAGVKRFIFMSSVKVYGERGGPFSEASPCCPETEYGQSKLQAEQQLMAICDGGTMEYVILRPPLVYGPGVKGNFRRLVQWASGPLPTVLGTVRNRRSMVYLGNLVHFVELAARLPAAANEVFVFSDGQDLSTDQIIKELRRELGRKPSTVALPLAFIKAARAMPGTRQVFDRLLGTLRVDDSKSRYLLGWMPPFTVLEGFERTLKDDQSITIRHP